jgi:hypothetical protein
MLYGMQEGLPPVLADSRRVQEALAHIVDHSLHYLLWAEEGYTDNPRLRISAMGLPGGPTNGKSDVITRVALDVVDNGAGTPNFDLFDGAEQREPWEPAKSGLTAARELIGQMGGASVDVANVMGERRVRITLRVAE